MTLSIIIVNWNSGPLLRRCLDALPAASRGNSKLSTTNSQLGYEVWVVDNASTDDSLERARGSAQPFELLALTSNCGFARANNRAIRRTHGDIVLLLNPDTEPRSGSLAALADFFATHPQAGVVGPRLRNPDGTLQPSVRRFPTAAVLFLLLTRLAHVGLKLPALRRYFMSDFAHDREEAVDQVMGACFAIRRQTLDEIGPLDEGFRIWFEEVDYCRRALARGFQTWFTPSAEVVHHRAAAFRQVSAAARAWWFSRSALRYARKHLGIPAALLTLLAVPFALLTGLIATFAGATPGVVRSQQQV